MRINEVLALQINDFDPQANTLQIKKTLVTDVHNKIQLGNHTKTYNKKTGIDSGARVLFLTGPLSEVNDILLEEINKGLSNEKKLIFWNYAYNNFMRYSGISSWLNVLNKKYEIAPYLTTHILRHTCITRMREKGIDMKIIQYLVGHAENSNITDTVYTSVSKEWIQKELEKI